MKPNRGMLAAAVLLWVSFAGANEIWITPTGQDGAGNGTAASPYVCSSRASFDNLIPSLSAHSTIHLMAGLFATGGNVWMPKGCKLRGAGMDATIVRMANHVNFVARYHGISPTSIDQPYPVIIGQSDGCEVSDLTVDCNLENNRNFSYSKGTNHWKGIAVLAVTLTGSDVKISRVKAVHWGTTARSVECPVLQEGALPNNTESTNLLIEDCLVTEPAQVSFQNGADAFAITGGGNAARISSGGWLSGVEIRNCRCFNVGIGTFGNPNYFNGLSFGDNVLGERIDNNIFVNVSGQIIMSSCNSAIDGVIDNNMLIGVQTGIGFQPDDWCPDGKFSIKRNIRIANNFITVRSGGVGLSLSGLVGKPIDGLDIENNLVRAAEGAGTIRCLEVNIVTNLTIRNNLFDANGGIPLSLGPSVHVAQISNNQDAAGHEVGPPGGMGPNGTPVVAPAIDHAAPPALVSLTGAGVAWTNTTARDIVALISSRNGDAIGSVYYNGRSVFANVSTATLVLKPGGVFSATNAAGPMRIKLSWYPL